MVRSRRMALALTITGVVILLLYTLPTGSYVIAPGGLSPARMAIETAFPDPNTGGFFRVSVGVLEQRFPPPWTPSVEATPILLLRAAFLPGAQVRPLEEITSAGTRAEYQGQLSAEEAHARIVPLIVALRAANRSYSLSGGNLTVTGHSRQGVPLKVGAVIVSVDGAPVATAEELRSALRDRSSAEIGTVLDGSSVMVLVELVNGTMGVYVREVPPVVEHDVPVNVTLGDFGGASGDLALALHIYSLLQGEDLTRGRMVVATGVLDADGTVLPVSGIELKAAAAVDADLFLRPDGGAEHGVPARSFAEALAILRE